MHVDWTVYQIENSLPSLEHPFTFHRVGVQGISADGLQTVEIPAYTILENGRLLEPEEIIERLRQHPKGGE